MSRHTARSGALRNLSRFRFAAVTAGVVLLSTVPAVTASPAVAAGSCGYGYVAHRGNHERPGVTENGMPAIRAASGWFEVDVRLNASGGMVLMHDTTVDRTTNGRGAVANMTSDQVRRLRLDDGTRVPFIATVLRHLQRNPRKHAMLHLRDFSGAKLAKRVQEFGVTSQVTLWGLRREHVDVAIGSTRTAAMLTKALDPYNYRMYDGIVVWRGAVTRDHVVRAHSLGLTYWSYTSNYPRQWQRLRVAGVDRTLTDRPSAFRAWCAKATG